MKKITSVALAVGAVAVLCLAPQAKALNLGGVAKEAGKMGGRAVAEKEINKNLAAKNCAFKPKSSELTCDIQDILSAIRAQKTIAEQSGLANDVDLHVEIGRGKDPKNANLGSQRQDFIRNNIRQKISWWDWYDSMTEGDRLKIYIKVQ